jgi:imidazolonepropionase-like amidohydrolase
MSGHALVNGLVAGTRRSVIITGGMIAAITPPDAPAPVGHEIHDLAGRTVSPGLVDVHVHLVFTGSADPRADVVAMDDDELFHLAASNAQTALAAGITTVRDCGSRGTVVQRLRDAINAGEIAGPRILASGPPICGPAGHLWFMGGAISEQVPAAQAARRLIADGADVIKVMASGGNLTPGSNSRAAELSAAELASVVGVAHGAGRRVAAHAHSTESIRRSVAAGVDTIEHASWLAADGGFAYDPKVAADIARRAIAVSPAITADFRDDLDTLQAARRTLVAGRIARTREMYLSGVSLIIGTDAGCPRIGFADYPAVAAVYVRRFGMSPAAATAAATTGGAMALGLSDVTGSLAPGMSADLIVTDGDPAQNIGALARVTQVFARGSPVAPVHR